MHEERGLLNDIMPDVYDEIGAIDGAVKKVVCGERSISEEAWMVLVDYAFAHLRGYERNSLFVDKLAEDARSQFSIGSGAYQEQRMSRVYDKFHCLPDRLSSPRTSATSRCG